MDVFASGVILYIMLNRNYPFEKAGDNFHKEIIQDPHGTMKNRGFDIEPEAASLIAKMIALDPS